MNEKQKSLTGHVVIIDDEENMCKILAKILELEGLRTTTFSDPSKALKNLPQLCPDVVLTDVKMPNINGMEVLARIKQFDSNIVVIMMTAYGTIDNALEAMRLGAYHYISKPFNTDELILTLQKALEHKKLKEENVTLTERISQGMLSPLLIGESKQIADIKTLVDKIANTDSSVLIIGESGTGKELIAKLIHQQSDRRTKRFVAINCASIPETLIESELFGYEKGAFTGAYKRKMGLVELAHHGTLFLDEIGDLALPAQAKLLRVLQEKEIQRVGGVNEIKVDIRLIAATNQNLEQAIRSKQFREDLFYRLNVINVTIPPLRERKGDIPLLADFFLQKYGMKIGKPNLRISDEALEALKCYQWHGNVRELENIVERMVVLVDGDTITVDDIPLDISKKKALAGDSTGTISIDGDYRSAKNDFERSYFKNILKQTGGNVTKAASLAGISRRHFYEKMDNLRVERGDNSKQ